MNNMWWDKLVNMWWEGEPKKEDLVEYLADDDILDPANPKLKIYYEKKYEVVNKIKPKVMMEIGVRAGYSSFAFLSAAPKAKLYAIDVNKYMPDRTQIEEGGVSNVITMYGGIPDVFIDVAPKILSGFDVKFIEANSQEYTELPYDVDFIHIDGDHSYSGVMHDLNISKNHAEWMLVDDYDYIPRIKKAVDKFLSDNPDFTYEYIDDGFRGNMLIHTSFRRLEEDFMKINEYDKKFLIISSFYNNTKDHIKQTFDNVINQTYKNWLFVVTDDFSENDCKKLLQEEIKKRNHPNIIYYEEKYKREIYLYQNFFKGINYDYYLDISSDDILYSNMLEIYNYHFEKYPEVFSIFCDYTVVDENGRRERISVVKTSDDYIEEFKERTHPNQGGINGSYWHIWSKYHSWNMYGIGMCFRKSKRDKFLIEFNCRSSTDSILFFNTLSEGNHLNIPRNLYTLVNRPNSDSSGMSSDEFSSYNSNALLAIDEYSKTLEFGSVKVYDDVWLETNALSNAEFVEYVDDINLITDIDELQLDKIRDLYYGKNISVNDKTKQNWIIIWNKLNEDQRIKMLKALQNYDGNFLIYNFLDDFNVLEDDIQKYFEDETTSFIEDVSEYETNFKWFSYFRHIIITRRN